MKGKGKGQEEKGKGTGGGNFQGQCYWCGEWGHSQSHCKQKDKYMEGIRKKGAGKGSGEKGTIWNIKESEEARSKRELGALEALEQSSSWRTLCSVEGIKIKNYFQALENQDDSMGEFSDSDRD